MVYRKILNSLLELSKVEDFILVRKHQDNEEEAGKSYVYISSVTTLMNYKDTYGELDGLDYPISLISFKIKTHKAKEVVELERLNGIVTNAMREIGYRLVGCEEDVSVTGELFIINKYQN